MISISKYNNPIMNSVYIMPDFWGMRWVVALIIIANPSHEQLIPQALNRIYGHTFLKSLDIFLM